MLWDHQVMSSNIILSHFCVSLLYYTIMFSSIAQRTTRRCCSFLATNNKATTTRNQIQCQHRRTFFASSTDHTRLLEEAEVHKLIVDDNIYQYVLVDYGMDTSTVVSKGTTITFSKNILGYKT